MICLAVTVNFSSLPPARPSEDFIRLSKSSAEGSKPRRSPKVHDYPWRLAGEVPAKLRVERVYGGARWQGGPRKRSTPRSCLYHVTSVGLLGGAEQPGWE